MEPRFWVEKSSGSFWVCNENEVRIQIFKKEDARLLCDLLNRLNLSIV